MTGGEIRVLTPICPQSSIPWSSGLCMHLHADRSISLLCPQRSCALGVVRITPYPLPCGIQSFYGAHGQGVCRVAGDWAKPLDARSLAGALADAIYRTCGP